MQQIPLAEAQEHLNDLVDAALQGETIFIIGQDQQLVQLIPVYSTKKPRKAGSARGLVKMAADFDAPLGDFADYME